MMRDREEKLKRKAKEGGLGNVSDDVLFVAGELGDAIRDARNLVITVMLSGFGILIGISIGIGVPILTSL